jgi:hypothetical protein
MTEPLITYNDLRRFPLPVKESQWDAIGQSSVETTIEYASQAIIDYLDIGVSSAYYTDRLNGSNRPTLMLEQYPVQSLHSVTSYDPSGVGTSLTITDFGVDTGPGIIYFLDRTKNNFYGSNNYSVYYRAGWDVVPGPIKHSVALQTIQMLQPMFRGGQNFGEVKLIEGLNEEIVDLLERYKRKRIG